jgi:prepilin-type N-terminal cleavage/methylation domain-containing protein
MESQKEFPAGVTLIEMLVVVTIIAVFAAIVGRAC